MLKESLAKARNWSDAMLETARQKSVGESLVSGPGANWGPYGSETTGLKRERLRHFTSWTAAVIRVAAQKIASQPFYIGKKGKKKDKPGRRSKYAPVCLKKLVDNSEIIEEHLILEVLRHPSDLLDFWSLMFLTICSIELSGEAYWFIDRSERQRPYLWYLQTDWVRPVHTETTPFDHYEILVPSSGHHLKIGNEDMVRFHIPDLKNPYYGGLSNLSTNAMAVVTDEYLQLAQQKAFQNGLLPGIGIIIGRHPDVSGKPGEKPILTKEQRASLMAALKQAYRGSANAGEPVILDGLIDDIKTLTQSPNEMGFLESGKDTKDRIVQGFHTNPIVLGQVENVNRASATIAEENWLAHKINPFIERISATLTHHLLPRLGEPDLLFWMETCRAHDPDAKRADLDQLIKGGAITRNELRETYDLAPLPGPEGDELIEPGPQQPSLAGGSDLGSRSFRIHA